MQPRFSAARSAVLSLGAAAFLAAALAACGGSGSSGVSSLPQTQSPAASQPASGRGETQNVISVHGISAEARAIASKVRKVRYHLMLRQGMVKRGKTPSVSYPDDLQYHGGNVMHGKVLGYNIYLNSCTTAPADCWGDPDVFENHLGQSSFIGSTLNQYMRGASVTYGMDANSVTISQPLVSTSNGTIVLGEEDVIGMVVTGLQTLNINTAPGYTKLFHVFLPPGVDECMDSGQCYSPDMPSRFYFCAYHGYVDLPQPYGHVIFSVEPYQGIVGTDPYACYDTSGDKGSVTIANATASTLSHETFEALSDPDLNAWWNSYSGEEVADECQAFHLNMGLNKRTYWIQKEYSNKAHGCMP